MASSALAASPGNADKAKHERRRPSSVYPFSAPVKKMNDANTGVLRKKLAACLYKHGTRAVDDYLENRGRFASIAEMIGTPPGQTTKQPFAGCLDSTGFYGRLTVIYKPETFRPLFVEEAYLSKFDNAPQLPTGAVEILSRPPVPADVEADSNSGVAAASLLAAISDCLVFKDTSGADALLRTRPFSAEERTVAISLAPAFGGCLPQGQTLKVNPQMIRALAADGLWARYARTVH
jgi:hypothetical protein